MRQTHTKYPPSAVHRARLLEALLRAMPSNVTTHFSTRVNTVENIDKKARVTYTRSRIEGSDEGGAIDADVIVGADGIKSAVRTQLQLPSAEHAWPSLKGEKLPPATYRYTGSYCYRGLVPMDKATAIDTHPNNSMAVSRMWFGQDSHILIFPIEKGTVSENKCSGFAIY